MEVTSEVIIRSECLDDIPKIHALTTAAFLNAEHTDHTEQFIVLRLREAGALTVSLVAEVDDVVVGHVAISPVTVDGADVGWFGLGPISVDPSRQGEGIGSVLMDAALNALRALGASGCVVLGDPGYYSRFGFRVHPGFEYPGVPAEYFQAISFNGEVPRGYVAYHDAFAATA